MDARRRKLTEDDLLRMRIPKRFWDAKLGHISNDCDPNVTGGAQSAQSVARKFVLNIDDMLRRGDGLLAWGPNGVGKTCMVVAIAKEARRRGHTVMFMASAELRRLVIENEVFDATTGERMLDRARRVDLLLFDDLGKGTLDGKEFGIRALEDLLRDRMSHCRSTFITQNVDPADAGVMEELVKLSTLHAMMECTVTVHVCGRDRRIENRRAMLAKMRENDG